METLYVIEVMKSLMHLDGDFSFCSLRKLGISPHVYGTTEHTHTSTPS